jgi:hypothetical protein
MMLVCSAKQGRGCVWSRCLLYLSHREKGRETMRDQPSFTEAEAVKGVNFLMES